ncbi:MAG: hypothetical protein EXR68_03770 [Dehalococcoidia bacterium]|nr:hypothetical protein [Dehalococcoidia bacterium]
MATRGQFDVVPYLMRQMLDCHSLINTCGRDGNFAERFLDGEEKLAGPARKAFIADLRNNGHDEDALWIEQRFLADYGAGNDLAHLGKSQVQRILAAEWSRARPVLGGRADPEDALLMWSAILDQEHWVLIVLNGFGGKAVEDPWRGRFAAAQQRWAAFVQPFRVEESDEQ